MLLLRIMTHCVIYCMIYYSDNVVVLVCVHTGVTVHSLESLSD